MDSNIVHRPGVFKHPNKLHKTGRHRSKGSISKEIKGKSDVKTVTKKRNRLLNKQDKKNRLNQLRKQKREEILEQKRSRGTQNTPPFLVTVLPTCKPHINKPEKLVDLFHDCDDINVVNDDRSHHISCQRFKQRYELIFPNSLIDYMDAVKVSDCLMLLLQIDQLNLINDDNEKHTDDDAGGSHGKLLDCDAEKILSCLFSQGLSSVVICCLGLKEMPVKKQSDMKKSILKLFHSRFPDEKLLLLDSSQDAFLLLKHIGSQRLNEMPYRNLRSFIFASQVKYTQYDDDDDSKGTLEVSGYLRGSHLSSNQLLHIPGFGNFQMSMIQGPVDPYPLNIKKVQASDVNFVRVLHEPNPGKQESLEYEVEVDEMDNEQTWPTEKDIQEAEKNLQMKKIKKKLVPKGFSDYQASWLDTDDDDDDDYDDDDDDDDMSHDNDDDDNRADNNNEESENGGDDEEENEEMETMSIKDDDDVYDEKFDEGEEEQLLQKYKDARLQQMFPDEVDTPQHQPARVRFQKYRGLSSFRTSPWDSHENLPAEYGKIVRFDNFKLVRRRVMKKVEDDDDEKVSPGMYVTVHILNVPSTINAKVNSNRPIVVFALLPFEQKLSVLHFLIRRCPGDREPIKSKESMVMHVGCHRFKCKPIYSQHTNASKHKFEKFFAPESTLVATVYAPIIYPPATALMFKDDNATDGENKLIGTGTLLSVNPDRMIIKRVVLSGHPFKINRKTAVVRYMFFNREDIIWFKPVELRTKYGRNGHIKEPLGTHGHMKCIFNKQLQSQDTVLINLYKRVYPKWIDFKQLYK